MFRLVAFSMLLLHLWSCDSSGDSGNSSELAVCNPSEKRCYGEFIQSCNLLGLWEDIPCPAGYSCFLVNNEPSCEDRNQGGSMPRADMTMGGNQGGSMPRADMTVGGNQGGSIPRADMTMGGNQGGSLNMVDMMVVEIDLDGDGFTVLEGDCDDSNANIYPNAPEIFGDQIDQDCDQLADVEDGVCEASFALKVGDNPELILDGCRSWEVDLNYEYDPDTTPKINGGLLKFKATTERNFECDLTLEFTSLSCGLDQVYKIGSTLNISDCTDLADQYEGSYHINPDQGLIVSFTEINTGNQSGNFSGAPLFTQISGHVGILNKNGITLNNQQGNFQSYLYGSFSISSVQVRDDAEQNFDCNQNDVVTVYDFDGDGESSFVYGYGAQDCDDQNSMIYSLAPEACNEIDDNCNEIVDEGLINCCGDGIANGDEQCDDANSENTDRCTNTCNSARCGDAFVQPEEECDDGNNINDDLCRNNCQIPTPCGANCPQMEMILIQAGSFNMGSNNNGSEQPIHNVEIRGNFYVGKTEVTVGQYRACVNVGVCSEPDTLVSVLNYSNYCNWTSSIGSKETHPVNCVDWNQARTFAKWIGGDLLTEAQWEYVATGQGQAITYPWGNAEPTCQLANYSGCVRSTLPVCSTTRGNTTQGVCDMGGNVFEWVLDDWHPSYNEAPIIEQAWCNDMGVCNTHTSAYRVFRSGSWRDSDYALRSTFRNFNSPEGRNGSLGFRVSDIIP
jgi:cysteine-rich repeat protein